MKSVSNSFLYKQHKITEFHRNHTFEKRKEEADRILKYPDRIPVIVQCSKTNTSILNIDKYNYLVPRDL